MRWMNMIICIGVDHLRKEKHYLETSAGTFVLLFINLLYNYDINSIDIYLFTFLTICSRKALGLPLEEPGRYVDASYFGKGKYDPSSPLYRYDYWGEPKNSEKSRRERRTDTHNKAIVGKGTVWYEMSYEDCIKQQMRREAQSMAQQGKQVKDEDTKQVQGAEDEDEDDDDDDDDEDDDDFDFSILSRLGSNGSDQVHVNGTESSSMSDETMFED